MKNFCFRIYSLFLILVDKFGCLFLFNTGIHTFQGFRFWERQTPAKLLQCVKADGFFHGTCKESTFIFSHKFLKDIFKQVYTCWMPPQWRTSQDAVLYPSLLDHFKDWHYLLLGPCHLSSILLCMELPETLLLCVLSWEVIHVHFPQITVTSLILYMEINIPPKITTHLYFNS